MADNGSEAAFVEFERVQKSYDGETLVVKDLNLSLPKGEFLRAFGADVFFDDQPVHCASAGAHVATGHVPHGIANQGK